MMVPVSGRPPEPPDLRAQVVVRGNPLDQIWRLMWGLVAAAQQAEKAGRISSLELALGDCSERPLAERDVRDLTSHARAAGLSGLSYEFFDQNIGHSGGQNRLASGAAARLLLLMNPDSYPSPTMVRELVARLDDTRIGIAEARQIPFEHPKAFDLQTGDTSWASGCCLAIPRAVFEAVGGFSPDYFPLHCNDVDLSWRVALAGYRVVQVPGATVFHDKPLELSGYPRTSPAEVYHSTLGRLMLCVRYANPEVLEETLEQVRAAGTQEQVRAVEEFERRRAEGSLPDPLEGAERVARFIRGEYAEHRY